ncbi:putative N-acetyltransferase YhbS [Tepidamorphus gemmatus]|jgi:predicted N-acetyltransferase YhbS|uniref:Putative N-acetyltransferase YhbS n=1 Tax=Tepidamorphus gemmatus TaxID=747076 RepID=A0A4R3MJK0_9HYPH|nr:putative N-acetyltransferase YhbS [Tepidamorphus gemmatus]
MSPAASVVTIELEQPGHGPQIDALAEAAFGPGRFAKTAYRLRRGTVPIPDLCFVALADGRLIGSVRLSPITIGGTPALLLGPLVVDPDYKNRGHGLALLKASITAARQAGHRLIILVGDAPYYARAGFRPIPRGQVRLPGPVDPDRLLALELVEGALAGATGMARPAPAEASTPLSIPCGGERGEEQNQSGESGQQRQRPDTAQNGRLGRLQPDPVAAVK